MDAEAIRSAVQAHATAHDLLVWKGIPWGGATALWDNDHDLDGFLQVGARVAARIIYLDDSGEITAFAHDGVVHAFATTAARSRILGDWSSEIGVPLEIADNQMNDATTFRTDVDRRSPYYDWQSQRVLEGELRELADRLANDPRYDGYRTRNAYFEYCAHLDHVDLESVRRVADGLFRDTIEPGLEKRAAGLVPELAQDPDFDPLGWGDNIAEFLRTRLPDEDPRVLSRLQYELPSFARDSGLTLAAEREVSAAAESVLTSMTISERDQFGFTSKWARRMQILEPYLRSVSERRRPHVARLVGNLEAERYATAREARYATVARALLNEGQTKAAVSRQLGISTTVMDRLVGSYREDVEIAPDDPLQPLTVHRWGGEPRL